MKIRNGFVSNSSSSSFLVLIPAHVNTFDDFIKDITNDDRWCWCMEFLEEPTCDYFETHLTNREALEKLWFDLQKRGTPAIKDDYTWCDYPEVVGRDSNKVDHYYASQIAYWTSNTEEECDKREAELETFAHEWNKGINQMLFESFFAGERECGRIYEIEYGDHNGEVDCQMENGKFWELLDHIKISNH
jgi:hypothetical protein